MFVVFDEEYAQAFGPFDSEDQARGWIRRCWLTSHQPDNWRNVTILEITHVDAEDEDFDLDPREDNYRGGTALYGHHAEI